MHDGSTARRESGLGPAGAAAHPLVPILLVAAAIFLIVLILARTPLQGFVISQRVQAAADRAATNTPLATEQVAAWLKADAVLASTVQQVCPRDSLAAQTELIALLGNSLDVQAHENRENRAAYQLSLRLHDRQLASRLLSKLSESLTSQLKHLDLAETQLLVQHYQKLLAQAREEEDSNRLALERARHEELTIAMQNSARAPLASEANPSSITSAVKTNPAWLELQQKVTAAQAKLDQLLAARTPQHPQVIEAQTRLTNLLEQLDQTPREPARVEEKTEPTPALRGPELPESAQRQSRVTVRLISSAGESAPNAATALAKQIQNLTAQWSASSARRAGLERSYNEAQQQWVRGLNAAGWEASAAWTHGQQGGSSTPFQLLLAGVLATVGGVGTWRLVQLASRTGLLSSVSQLQDTLPLPVLGEVPLSTTEPQRMPAQLNKHVLWISQLSLAVVLAVFIVCVWATSSDPNMSHQWGSDPLSALGQAFDLLHQRVVG
jgi:hypothetical protein